MKKQFGLVIILCGLLACYGKKVENSDVAVSAAASDDVVVAETSATTFERDTVEEGDFNGDGKLEYAIRVRVNGGLTDDGPRGYDYIEFSDVSIPVIKTDVNIDLVMNETDLNGDGRDEVGFLMSGANGFWMSYSVMTLQDKEWIEFIPEFSVHIEDLMDENSESRLVTKSSRKGYVTIRESDMTTGGVNTRSVKYYSKK
jgi:hypothetical protein